MDWKELIEKSVEICYKGEKFCCYVEDVVEGAKHTYIVIEKKDSCESVLIDTCYIQRVYLFNPTTKEYEWEEI